MPLKKKYAHKPSTAGKKYNMSNVAINRFLLLLLVYTEQKREKLELKLCMCVHKRERFILGVSLYMK